MKLTSKEIAKNLDNQQDETKRIGDVETKLKSEAEGMKTAFSQMKETGEYDAIKTTLERGVREEVKVKKRVEVTKKLDDVNKVLDTNIDSNQETISDLDNNLNQVESIKTAEVATGANEQVNEAKQSYSKALEERNDLGTRLSQAIQNVSDIIADSDKIEI